MKSAAVLAAALALATGAHAAPADIDAVFAGYTRETPGCAVGVKPNGEAPVFRAYGSADLEHAVPITAETVFEAGSVSKQFTAAAILLLAQDGELALSDDIRKYLPEMPDYGAPITVGMLLSHTSGLRDWGEVMELAGWPRTSRVYTHAEVLQIASRQAALNYAPGEAYSYTNTGYNLAAWIVLRVSGKTLAQFTAERIFRPLGMTRTGWRDDFRRVVPGRATAYRAAGDGAFAQDMPFENTYGHAGLLTTVGDLLTWNEALTGGKLGPGFDARMRERPTLTGGRTISYARGLMVLEVGGRGEVSHSGSTAGYRAWLARLPAEGLSVALLCNRADANPVQLGHKVVEAVLGARPAPARAAPPAADLERLPGIYVDERAGGVLRVVARDGALGVRGGGAFTPAGEGRYLGGGAEFAFRDEGVRRTTPDGEVATYRRVEPVSPTVAELQALAGTYASGEAGGVWVASVRGEALVLAPGDRPSGATPAVPLHRDAFLVGGNLVRVVRDEAGQVTALRFTGARVYALDFRRVARR